MARDRLSSSAAVAALADFLLYADIGIEIKCRGGDWGGVRRMKRGHDDRRSCRRRRRRQVCLEATEFVHLLAEDETAQQIVSGGASAAPLMFQPLLFASVIKCDAVVAA